MKTVEKMSKKSKAWGEVENEIRIPKHDNGFIYAQQIMIMSNEEEGS